jgi:hypothetical protein
VKQRYHAWVTQAEHDAMARVLATCPDQKLPKSGQVRVPVAPTHPAPSNASPAKEPATPKPAPASSGKGRVFANCAAVRAAGLAPLLRGTADYAANPNLDRDKDGVACE